MTRRMLIEATHPEETRVVVVDGKRLEEFDYESANKRQLKGNIYLAKITRVEPSLQAAFVDYGGNRHGFLAFSEIHPDYYRIPVADREALLAEHAAMAAADAASDNDDEEDLAVNVRADLATSSNETTDSAGAASVPAEDDDAAEASSASDEAGDALPLTMSTARLFGPEIESATESEPGDEAAGDNPAGAEENGAGDPQITPATASDQDAPRTGEENIAPRSPGTSLETVGGDEAEDVRRRRSRPLRRYKIQEVIKRRQIMLVQVTKEERGNKGAALTTYLSLAGRYCVLMPNTGRGGGISRKITNAGDRKRLKSILEEFDIPDGMAVIVRTAGSERNKTELRRDYEYLRAPVGRNPPAHAAIDGADSDLRGSQPDQAGDPRPLRARHRGSAGRRRRRLQGGQELHAHADAQSRQAGSALQGRKQPPLSSLPGREPARRHPQPDGAICAPAATSSSTRPRRWSPSTSTPAGRRASATSKRPRCAPIRRRPMRSGASCGCATSPASSSSISSTWRSTATTAAVERRLKEAMRHDRARIQVGRISAFGLLELSRQRLRPSLIEASTEVCRHCRGSGHVRSTESTALHVLRAIEEEGIRNRSTALVISVPTTVALYILNNKRAALAELEQRHNLRLTIAGDDALIPPDYRMERSKTQIVVPRGARADQPAGYRGRGRRRFPMRKKPRRHRPAQERPAQERPAQEADGGRRRSRRRRRGRRDESRPPHGEAPARFAQPPLDDAGVTAIDASEDEREEDVGPASASEASDEARPGGDIGDQDAEMQRRRRRRGRRGGRRRRRGNERQPGTQPGEEGSAGMSPLEEQAPSDRPVGNWSGESDQPPYRYDADRPGEPAIDATTRDNDRSPFVEPSRRIQRRPARPRGRA